MCCQQIPATAQKVYYLLLHCLILPFVPLHSQLKWQLLYLCHYHGLHTTEEKVVRILSFFKDQGILATHARKVTVKNKRLLEIIAEGF